jgi:hypothetical protein
MKRLAILATVALAVAACGGAASTATLPALITPTAPTAPAATIQATPAGPGASPTVAASAADQYTAIANKGNAALAKCGADLTAAGNDLAKAKVAAGECLAAVNQYETDLGALRWGSVQPQVDDVVKALGTVQVLWGQMANASDAASFTAAVNQMATADGALTGAVNVLRSALGLPPSQAIAS